MPFPFASHQRCCRFVAGCWIFVAAWCTQALGVEIAPYEARVVASGATVHSGPGEKFYPTDSLAQGDVVEVYQEKPGGWLGIRPTVNSFSWVSGRELKVKDGGLGEIQSDGTASRIGSRLSDKHNAAQVQLKKGELVEVLGEESFGGETWYKIAPPAGEFRWIQSALVERAGPIRTVSAESPATANEPAKNAVPLPTTDVVPPPLMPSTAPTDWKSSQPADAVPAKAAAPSASPPSATPTAPSGATAGSPSSVPAEPAVAPASPASPSASLPVAASPAASNSPASAAGGDASTRRLPPTASAGAATTFDDELAAVEVRLSRMASAPVNLWNTERLERDAAQLLARARTPAEREAVQNTLSKIGRFAAIGRRTTAPATALAQVGQPPVTPVPGAAPAAGGGQYDAVGILRPVVSRRPGAPQFALVDERGQVLSFVTPSPDVNLQPYLGRRVGVVGSRGFIAEFNRAHVTAARVTPMVR